jgi:putative transposase
MEERKKKSNVGKCILTWSHYKFCQTLKGIAERYKARVIPVTEEFTSKCCGKCGKLNHELGSQRIFKCQRCGMKMKRDINGARNVLLKYMTEKTTFETPKDGSLP